MWDCAYLFWYSFSTHFHILIIFYDLLTRQFILLFRRHLSNRYLKAWHGGINYSAMRPKNKNLPSHIVFLTWLTILCYFSDRSPDNTISGQGSSSDVRILRRCYRQPYLILAPRPLRLVQQSRYLRRGCASCNSWRSCTSSTGWSQANHRWAGNEESKVWPKLKKKLFVNSKFKVCWNI